MGGRFLLDTNTVIALFTDRQTVRQQFAAATDVFIPCVVLGELYFGAERSAHLAENRDRVDAFASANAVLVCNTDTGRQYGRIKQSLRSKGRPIPDNDIWIAATALQHDLILVTEDAHFAEVDTLECVRW